MPTIPGQEVGICECVSVLFILIKTGQIFSIVTAEQLCGCADKTALWGRIATTKAFESTSDSISTKQNSSYRLDHTCDAKILPGRTVYPGTLLHTLPMFVSFVGSLLSLDKSCSRPLFLSLKMEHKFETKTLSGFQVPAVTKEGRKSMLPVAKHQTSKGNRSDTKAQKRRLQGFPMPLVMVVFIKEQRFHIHL